MTIADTILPSAQPPPPRQQRWTKAEYYRLVESGELEGKHIFLFRGEILEMPPQYHPQAFAITRLNKALGRAFGLDTGFEIRIQLPFETPGESVPEPDALVCTEEQNLRKPHPNQALLVVEVADSSLAVDREKALEYAAAAVREYWIIDVQQRRAEVYRGPLADPTAALGFRYPPPMIANSGESIEPLARPGARIVLAELFAPT